ncbi:MAG: hypothetical protein GXZ19_01630 [Bacteroidales bacterium]|nr:hypothetical protein [Bacteroidales bacterium]
MEEYKGMTPEQIIDSLNLTEEDFPNLNRYQSKEYLLRVLQGLAKASGCSLETAAINLEHDKSMM